MKRVYRITFLTVAAVIICVVAAHQFLLKEDAQKENHLDQFIHQNKGQDHARNGNDDGF